MLERRRQGRNRSFTAGTIAHLAPGRVRKTMDCVVRDASDGGALLLMDEPGRAPAELELATGDGVRAARVVWRGDAGIGVAFLPAAAAAWPEPAAVACGVVLDLGAARRQRAPDTDEARLAERIARFVRPSRRPDPV